MEIQIDSINKHYGDYTALDNVSFTIPSGSIYGLLGPNGAGKTSLIRIVNQITGPDTGEIRLDGQKLRPTDVHRIGYLPEERGLYKKMEVGEQAMYLAQLKGMSKADAKKSLKYWFERFEIQDWWKKKVEELSKGMAQKIQFITTILHDPEFLIFDEPFSGFDPINAELIKNEILEINKKGTTILFSTHRMESVEQLCEHIALINRSKVVLNGPLKEVQNNFRDQTYDLGIGGIPSGEIVLPEGAQLLKDEQGDEMRMFRVRLQDGQSTSDLLKAGMAMGQIEHLEEVIPSVNDIFIRTVQESHE
jgi:ABC-2 type transport system ATP-binding protein